MAIARTYKAGRTAQLLSLPKNNTYNSVNTGAINTPSAEEEKNVGGFIGGLGYFFEKLGVGMVQSVEGLVDYTVGGIAKLVGEDEYAEQVFDNDWINYDHPDEWFNPGKGWSVAGDVAAGIGSSIPGIVAGAVSGGTLAPVIAGATMGLGAAGTATKEAYRESGELTGKEFAYGALSGATEALIETATGVIGVGSGRVVKSLAKRMAKESAKEVSQNIGKTLLKKVGADFLSEAFEEGMAEVLSPIYQRMTYNPEAENATAEEVLYAAFVGGMSGVLMGGTSQFISNKLGARRGNEIISTGNADGVIALSEQLAKYEDTHHTGVECFEAISKNVKALKASLEKTGGEIRTAAQKNMLATLEANNTVAPIMPAIIRSAVNIAQNPEIIAERLSGERITDEAGNEYEVTVESLLDGVDLNNARSVNEALKKNPVLRYLAVSEATGQLLLNTQKFASSVLAGKDTFTSDYDLYSFIKGAKGEELDALGNKLGITDWNTVSLEAANEAVRAYKSSEEGQRILRHTKAFKEAENAPAKKKIPSRPNAVDGVSRYNDGKADIGILREGGSYVIHNYDANTRTRQLSYKEATSVLKAYNEADASMQRAAVGTESNITNSVEVTTDSTIDLTNDNELAQAIGRTTGSAKYKIIQQYILDALGEQPISLSDGKNAIVDKRDALHIANKSGDKKTAQIAKIKELVESARLCAEDNNVAHNKFNYFCYYEANVKYGNETFPIYLNVGKGINDGLYHLYDITKRIGDTANRLNGFERPKPNEGYAQKINVSTNSIPNSAEKVNSESEKNSEKSNKYAKAIKEAEAFAEKNVKGYSSLSAPDKAKVAKTVMQARAYSFSDSDTKLLASVCAHSRLNIEINEDKCVREIKGEDGTVKREALRGLYDIKTKRIYINPKYKVNAVRILGHEAFHAMYDTLISIPGGNKLLQKAIRRAAKGLSGISTNIEITDKNGNKRKLTKAEKIALLYEKSGASAEVINEEFAAHFAEYFTDESFMSALIGEKPSLKDKILSFFKSAEKEYSDVNRLSSAARKYKNLYKKMFEAMTNVKTSAFGDVMTKNVNVEGDNDEDDGKRTAVDLDNTEKSAYNLSQENKHRNGDSINEQNSQDPELLAERNISTDDRGGNSVWQQGENPAEIYKRLADSQNDKGVRGRQRAGTSGWLGGIRGNKSSILRLGESVLGSLRRRQLNRRDTAGRILSKEVYENFKDTVFKNETGELLSVYHWTDASFEIFTKGDIGFHFGTLDAAYMRCQSQLEKNRASQSYFKECYINISNPVLIDFDPMTWDVFPTAYLLNRQKIITDKELSALETIKGFSKTKYDSPASEELRKLLIKKGFDGIIYSNSFEGDLSVIAFNADQIHTVAENGIDKENYTRFSVDLADTSIGYISTAYEGERINSAVKLAAAATRATVDGASSLWNSGKILLVNEQAGIERAGVKLGIGKREIEVLTQGMRSATNIAQTQLSDVQMIQRADGKWEKVGKGLASIFAPIKARGKVYWNNFQMYLFHMHNIDRMSLEEKSNAKHEENKGRLAQLQERNEEINNELAVANAILNGLKGKRNTEVGAERQKTNDAKKALLAELRANKKAINSLTFKIESFKPEQNKPVFGKEVNGVMEPISAEESRAEAARLLAESADFEKYAKKVYTFLDNLQKQRLEAGLIDENTYNYLKEKYPHYVPTMRETQNQGNKGVSGKFNIKVKAPLRTAKGGYAQLQPLDISISRMVQEAISEAAVNRTASALARGAKANTENQYVAEVKRRRLGPDEALEISEAAANGQKQKLTNQITYYEGGEEVTLSVSADIFAGFDAFNSKTYENALPVVLATKVNNGFKRLVTSMNPFFLVRNAIRDIQDAGINTRYPGTFLVNYARAIKQIMKNGEMWQLYRAAGGLSNSVFDYERGFTGNTTRMGFAASENKFVRFITSMERANMFIEQLPRFAEFMSSIKAGNTVAHAVLDAADVTTNFGRTGKLTKILNKTAIPFLNPAIQGMSKIVRNFSDAADFKHPMKMLRGYLSLAVKAFIVGIGPQMLNQLLLDDDEEYRELSDRDKENNYIIRFPGAETFVKIPKGRVAAVLASLVNKTSQEIEGKEADWKDFYDNVISNVTPIENFSRPIWQPFFDVSANKSWYGSKIEGDEFKNTRPENRYDESTSSIAIALGKLFNYSPKKIHYLLDQYSGVIGDFLLPLTTQRAERAQGNLLASNFTIDPVHSNKLSDEFYKIYEEAQYSKTDGNIPSIYKVKYLNSVKSAVSKLYDEKSKIQQSNLSAGEKLQQTRVIQALINEAYRNALNGYGEVCGAIASTQGFFDDSSEAGQKLRYTDITRRAYGAERALSTYSEGVYKKAQTLAGAGVDYDTYYYYYFGTKGFSAEKDENGISVPGSKRAKVIEIINSLDITPQLKMLLLTSHGFSLKDGDFGFKSAESARKRLLSYILSLKASQARKAELAKMCGFTVNGNKISLKAS